MSTPPRWIIPEAHDPKSCPVCGSYVTSAAFRRGTAKAKAQTADFVKNMEREDG